MASKLREPVESMTTEEYLKSLKGKKASKYHNVKTTVDGITFDSKREAQRYGELKLMEQAGEIRKLALQQKFELTVVEGKRVTDVGTYIADFTYFDTSGGKSFPVVEDCKGHRTAVYRIKKKLMKAIYNIEVKET